MYPRLRAAVAATALLLTVSAHANCGSAFCTVNTDWSVQGVYAEPGARAELRYEYLKQDQLQSGSKKVSIGEVSADHEELSTLNQPIFGTFSYNWASGWGVSAVVPIINREHEHIETDTGQFESWHFTELGDIRVAGRYQIPLVENPERPRTLGAIFGLKLPTGRSDVANQEGEIAERALQPGTGTLDAIIGGYYQFQFPKSGLAFFTQAQYTFPLDS